MGLDVVSTADWLVKSQISGKCYVKLLNYYTAIIVPGEYAVLLSDST